MIHRILIKKAKYIRSIMQPPKLTIGGQQTVGQAQTENDNKGITFGKVAWSALAIVGGVVTALAAYGVATRGFAYTALKAEADSFADEVFRTRPDRETLQRQIRSRFTDLVTDYAQRLGRDPETAANLAILELDKAFQVRGLNVGDELESALYAPVFSNLFALEQKQASPRLDY